MNAEVLVLAEHDNFSLKPATLHAITAANQLGKPVTVLVIGYQCQDIATKVSQIKGVNQVLIADNQEYQYQLPENVSLLIQSLAKDYQYIMAAATTFGKSCLPRVAALLEVGCLTDVSAIINENTFKRPIYAGNAFATVLSNDEIKVLTVRLTAFEAASTQKEEYQATIIPITKVFNLQDTRFLSHQLIQTKRPSLTAARVIVAGGRGLGSLENFKRLEALADKLGAAVGASRAAVDAGYAPNDYQIGQTGKIVAPDLYIAIGISGAIQHLAGMKESKIIVAINKDPEAPIFKIADYGLVGDLFTILTELEQVLS